MTKYLLKDADLQHHLDAISGGEFSEALKSGNVEFDEDGFATVRFGSSKHENNKTLVTEKFSVFLHKDELEELPEYNPDAWNHYPEVTPPENTWMRVIQSTNGWTRFTAAIYRDGKWYQELETGDQLFQKPILGVCEFRPWD